MYSKIVVVGSSNQDIVNVAKKLPQLGETIIGHQFMTTRGGKGANQAVAACRLGGRVSFITSLGNDEFAQSILKDYATMGIDVSHVEVFPDINSGVALIMVDEDGNNYISVATNANANLTPAKIHKHSAPLSDADYLLIQLETPLDGVEEAIKIAKQNGVCVILNPAPATTLPQSIYENIDIITPNQAEAELLTGIKVTDEASAEQAALALHQKGVETVVITLGREGAYLHKVNGHCLIAPGHEVDVYDTTAAGDTFNGALVVGLSEGMDIADAIRFANRASALSVQKAGAQDSIPHREVVEKFNPFAE